MSKSFPVFPFFRAILRVRGRLCRGLLLSIGIALLPGLPGLAGEMPLSDYRPVSRICTGENGQWLLAYRSFTDQGKGHYLAVHPSSLESARIPHDAFDCGAVNPQLERQYRQSPFFQAMEKYTGAPYRIVNHGLTGMPTTGGSLLFTVDMCPSSKEGFSEEFFRKIGDYAHAGNGPVPIAIAITGRWVERHPRELDWLKGEIASGRLEVTWINHTYNHPYWKHLPDEENFLANGRIDRDRFLFEVLENEKMLLRHGLMPSVFFRFPGLISREEHIVALRRLHLIPVGSDAWLSKGQRAVDGSIILVHGNRNEQGGIHRALRHLRRLGANASFVSLGQVLQ